MAAKLWGLPPPSFKVLELQPGENLSGRKSFSLMGEVLRRPLEDVLSERQARFLPSNGKLLRPASARRGLSRCVFARARLTLSLGRRKQHIPLSSDQSRTKERAQSPWLHPENCLTGNWFKNPNSTSNCGLF